MKIKAHCLDCISEDDVQSESLGEMRWVKAAPQFDGVLGATCANGHKFNIAISGARHETLYHIAMNALKDGYHRESVVSFASSMELFFEFFIRMTHYLANIDNPEYRSSCERLESTWSTLGDQSERQLGAYISCIEFMYGKTARIMNCTKVSFRNEVIHKGKIPSVEKALNFGQEVCDIIVAGVDLLYEKYGKDTKKFFEAYETLTQQNKIALELPFQHEMAGIQISDIVSGDRAVRDVRKYLKRMFGDEVKFI